LQIKHCFKQNKNKAMKKKDNVVLSNEDKAMELQKEGNFSMRSC
jgi:hypothetical protein